MTKKAQYTARNYETFPEHVPSESTRSLNDSANTYRDDDGDKSRSAAAEAKHLGSQGSWADGLGATTPATEQTPAASSTTDEPEHFDHVQYLPSHNLADPSDPPPLYTPSVSTAQSSPAMSRSVPEPVSAPIMTTVPVLLSETQRQQSRPSCNNDAHDCPYSTLPEPVQHCHSSRDTGALDRLPAFVRPQHGQGKRRGCGSHGRRNRSCTLHDKERGRRFKRICFFIFALLACLWLMIPGLCKSLSNVLLATNMIVQ
jgi:hypothetical protein